MRDRAHLSPGPGFAGKYCVELRGCSRSLQVRKADLRNSQRRMRSAFCPRNGLGLADEVTSDFRGTMAVVAQVPSAVRPRLSVKSCLTPFPCRVWWWVARGGITALCSPHPALASLPWCSTECKLISFPHYPCGFSHHNLNINSILTAVRDEHLMHCVSLEQAVWVEVKHSSSL